MPLLGAGALALYPALLSALRKLPAHEYEQAERAPAWFVTVIGAGMALAAYIALRGFSSAADQVFIGFPGRDPLLLVDANGLWLCLLLGPGIMAAAWVPAARRSLVPHAVIPFIITLVLAWLGLVIIFSLQLWMLRLGWLLLVVGVIGLWLYLYRPRWQWLACEAPIVLGLAGLFGTLGLSMLLKLAGQGEVLGLWNGLLSAEPGQTNAAVFLLAVGWLAPAVYLPWWLANRRDEEAMVWLPAALILVVVGALVWPRLVIAAFPVGSEEFLQLTGIERLFLIRTAVRWVGVWGVLALVGGVGWLGYLVASRLRHEPVTLRPLTIVAGGVLLISVAAAVAGQDVATVSGLGWMQLTWVGFLAIWLPAGALLPELTRKESGERLTLMIALLIGAASLLALPLTTGFRGLVLILKSLAELGISPALIISALIILLAEVAILFPVAWRNEPPAKCRPGLSWGILAPFLVALGLLLCALFAAPLTRAFEGIQGSLLQVQ